MTWTRLAATPVPVTPSDVDQALPVWAEVADDADHIGLALDLLPAGQEQSAAAVTRARLLLMAGRDHDALAELAAHHITEPSATGPVTWQDCVLAACLAGGGDEQAYRWLLRAATGTTGPAGTAVTYLLAAAAGQCGEQVAADQAWRGLAVDRGVRTGLTVARAAEALVAARDRVDATLATRAIAGAAALIESCAAPDEDPQPALAATDALERRGDPAGARLLLTALVRRNPPSPALSSALAAQAAPPGGLRYQAVAVTAVLAGLALVLVPGGVLALIFGRQAWLRLMPLPGLSRTDSRALRNFRALQYDPETGRAGNVRSRELSGLNIIMVIVALILATVVIHAVASLQDRTGLHGTSADVGLIGLTAAALAGLAFAARAGWQRHAQRRAQRQRQAQERAWAGSATQCRCWNTRYLSGRFSRAYRNGHLQPVPDRAAVSRLSEALNVTATLLRCPRTGVLWLDSALPGGLPLLMRGPVPADPNAPDSSGFYL